MTDLRLGTVMAMEDGLPRVRLDGAGVGILMRAARGATFSAGDRVLCAYISGVYIAILPIGGTT